MWAEQMTVFDALVTHQHKPRRFHKDGPYKREEKKAQSGKQVQ